VHNIGRLARGSCSPCPRPPGWARPPRCAPSCTPRTAAPVPGWLVLAPTGKAIDVAVREGAGDEGLTIAKAVQLLRDNKLELSPHTLVIVDEAAMVGTDDPAPTAGGHYSSKYQDGPCRRSTSAGPGQSPRRHVRPTLRRSVVDTTPFRGVAHARPRRTRRVARLAQRRPGISSQGHRLVPHPGPPPLRGMRSRWPPTP